MNRRQTTGRDLDADEAFRGLVDFGLFNEKVPPCFSSEGLERFTIICSHNAGSNDGIRGERSPS
ncbi:MAG: hypothetical protein J4F42_18345, partial [Desulfurellaceae bacterium]|nr:hypothetical protein [Desulfurellaceae bacterium]